ncbi:MAG: right-handed parallel beta-helix repeat-containing protein [Sphingomonadales bacterium]|nr:right-handed parallel beta-helix repeat-containing protein [Sphingomonadales bacterium]
MSKSAYMIGSLVGLAALLAWAHDAAAQADQNAPFQIAETGQKFRILDQAVKAIGNGQGTILIRPGLYQQCAVQEEGRIAYRAAAIGQVIFDRATCEGKAALVLRGQSASVDGIIFQGMAVADANGAGIRLEKGDLVVTRSIFRDSEQGILTAPDPSSSIRIDQSTFSGLGRCDRGLDCAHSIYIGDYGSLTVTNSRFERGNGGHYVKSRAARVDIRDNAFDDSRGHTTNYMIDLPGGATGTISGNKFVQGEDKENYSAFITVAPEGKKHSSAGLSIANNDARIGPGISRSSTFLADWSGDQIALGVNRLGPNLKRYERR